ncbi:MAG: hypothetical protein Q8L48_30010 [Archangium sp.]|nr:hypothetical protein [Archangium sp.]
MFDWLFKPKCPCDPAAKAWIEHRLRWLSEQFPRSAFSTGRELILPTPEFFPERYDASERAVRTLMGRVCSYMGVDETSIQLTPRCTSGSASSWRTAHATG